MRDVCGAGLLIENAEAGVTSSRIAERRGARPGKGGLLCLGAWCVSCRYCWPPLALCSWLTAAWPPKTTSPIVRRNPLLTCDSRATRRRAHPGGGEGSFWRSGLVGVGGGKGSLCPGFVGLMVFLATGAGGAWIAGAIAHAKRDFTTSVRIAARGGGGDGFLWFLLVGGPSFIVYWGFPAGVLWWLLWVVLLMLYLIVGGVIAEIITGKMGPHIWFT